jgi:YD repeat-containing protein
VAGTEVIRPESVSAAPPQLPTANPVVERADEGAALVTARMTGAKVRISGRTTETEEFFAYPDGRIEATVSAGPVRMRQNGGWVPIDLTLQPAADGSVRAVAHPFDLWISGGHEGAGELAAVGGGDRRLALGWPGRLPAPALAENRATYADVVPGIDLVVEATRTGFEQSIVVKTRDAVNRIPVLALPLTGKRLGSLRRDDAGGLVAKDIVGQDLATIPAPEMWDARRAPGSEEPLRRTTVATTSAPAAQGGGFVVRLQPDRGWLTDPATQFPVTIDPQINPLYTSFDTYVREGETVDRSGANDLELGYAGGTINARNRSFVHWPVSALAGKQITAATVNFWSFYSTTCSATSWEIWSTGGASSATRWSTQPAWLNVEATSTQTKGFSTTCDDGWVSLSGTSFFQRAATANQSTAYMGIRATNETDPNAFKQFRSRNAVDTNQVPYASITYNSYPTVGARSTTPATGCVTGSGRPAINSAVPNLNAVISDAEASPVKAEFEWWTTIGTAKLGSAITSTAASGSTLTTTVPAGVLTNGGSYKWRVRGNDGTADGAWSSFCEFTVDTSVVSPPIISSTTYPMNDWGGDAGVTASFTFSANGRSDTTAYDYSLDLQTLSSSVNAGTPGAAATVQITPGTAGWHTLYARSRNAAGTVSAAQAYPFKVGNGAVTSPRYGTITGAKAVLTSAGTASFADVTYQWRRASSDSWVTIPAAHVTYAAGGGAVTWPVALTTGTAPKLNWDVAATLSSVDAAGIPRDGPVQVRGYFNLSNFGASTNPVKFRFDRNLATADTAPAGPGSVNLITGSLQIGEADASAAGLSVSRTYNSRQPGGLDPLFGPGWISGTLVSAADAPYTRLTVYGSLVQVGLLDGSTIGFTKQTSTGTTFDPQIGAESYTLTYNSTSNAYTLTDGSGNVVTFTRTTTDPAGVYSPTSATAPGSGTGTTYSWEKVTIGGQDLMRPTRVLAPTADGVTCTTLVRGCKALTFAYATTTTATGTADGTWGDYTGRVSQISYTAWDPDLGTPAMRTVVLARYAYDNTGRLRAVWDPRLDWTDEGGTHSLRTTYTYDANGVITTMTPPAQQPWQFTYTTLPNDPGAGRLSQVTRTGAGSETVVYQVPVAGAGAPYDLSAAQTTRWGQAEQPTDATAVFPPTQIPTGNPATGTLPNSYERATVTYLDANARTVNTAEPGGYLSTTWYDSFGNVVQELSAGNRQRALDASTTDTAAAEAQQAAALSDVSVHSSDGQNLLETFGPEHDVVLPVTAATVRGRAHTRYTYDEGAPATAEPLGLVTTELASVSYVNAGQTVDDDVRTTTTQYDWTLQAPTVTTVDPAGLNLTARTSYDTAGRVTATTTPAGGSVDTTPATRVTVYYTNATNTTYPECGGHAEWAGLPCRTQPGGAAEAGPELLTTVYTYDMYGQPRTTVEKNSGGTLRTVTQTYDGAGRATEQTVTTAAGLGKTLEKRRTVYDPVSGQALRTQTVNGSNVVTAEVIRGYDNFGRQTSYTDTDGNTSTTTYNSLGQLTSTNDGKATRTYSYDDGAERRGLLTAVTDTQAGAFTTSYDADGAPIAETWPNGIAVTRTYDETGTPNGLRYDRPGCGQPNCNLYNDTAGYNIHNQTRWDSNSFTYRIYDYDPDSRLQMVKETIGGTCTARKYGFDQASNRTSLDTYAAAPDGTCQTSTTATSQSWTYDDADRATTTDYIYDALGRTTTTPAAQTANPTVAMSRLATTSTTWSAPSPKAAGQPTTH